jgi:hypothetical protein
MVHKRSRVPWEAGIRKDEKMQAKRHTRTKMETFDS